eukprot:766203-Hanusia_phi.AAC.13
MQSPTANHDQEMSQEAPTLDLPRLVYQVEQDYMMTLHCKYSPNSDFNDFKSNLDAPLQHTLSLSDATPQGRATLYFQLCQELSILEMKKKVYKNLWDKLQEELRLNNQQPPSHILLTKTFFQPEHAHDTSRGTLDDSMHAYNEVTPYRHNHASKWYW